MPVVLAGGFLAISAGLLGLSHTTRQPFPDYALWLLVLGIGFGLALPTLTAELASSLPPGQAGVAGGLQSATRELGSALGIAVVGTITVAVFSAHLPAGLRAMDPVPRTVAEAVALEPPQTERITSAFVTGASTALEVSAVLTVVAGALVVLRARGRDCER